MDRLTPLADAFIEAEDVDPAVSLTIGSLAVFAGPAPSYDEFVALLQSRLPLVPRYRQRVRTTPFDLAAPAWVDDPDFDIRHHVLRAAVPAPGGHREVADLVARLMAPRMDRSQPLWECWLCEGLEGGRWATLSRVHHCLADGVSGMGLYRLFLDPTPEVPPPPVDDWDPATPQTPRHAAAVAMRDLAGLPATVAGTLGRMTRTPLRAAAAATETARGLLELSGALRPVHPTSLTGPIGCARRYTWVEVDLPSVRALRSERGVTVNDIALTAITGGFRRLLLGRGEEPAAHAVRSLVPVSTRPPGEDDASNRVSLLLPYLPVDLADPHERLEVVHRRLRGLRDRHEPEAGAGITTAAELAPFAPVSWSMRAALRLPQHQVTTVTTNVPGPRVPLYCLGRPVQSLLPWVPIADRVRVGVAMVSYCDSFAFGITADHESAPDLEVLADGIAESWSELAAR